jgi:DNA primase (bacterial type)
LYNLPNAKSSARKKNNLLISEGYMDVISLFQNGIKSVVAPLGTALTEDQIKLAWKFSSKPTIMFDGDKAGLRASFKAAIMSLDLISPNKFLQFINLPDGYDPDSFINNFSFEELLKILKKPEMLVNFIFNQSSKTIRLDNADEKISFDKYLEDLTDKIRDNKIKFFYKNEFKSLFFKKIKNQKNIKNNELENPQNIKVSLFNKQILSFVAAAINHVSSREEIIKALLETDLFDENYKTLLNIILQKSLLKISPKGN